jgi:hypothetical protein
MTTGNGLPEGVVFSRFGFVKTGEFYMCPHVGVVRVRTYAPHSEVTTFRQTIVEAAEGYGLVEDDRVPRTFRAIRPPGRVSLDPQDPAASTLNGPHATLNGLPKGVVFVRFGCPNVGDFVLSASDAVVRVSRRESGRENAQLIVAADDDHLFVESPQGGFKAVGRLTAPATIRFAATIWVQTSQDNAKVLQAIEDLKAVSPRRLFELSTHPWEV